MRLFTCQACSQLLYFENKRCVRCDHKLGYIANDFQLTALDRADATAETWTALAKPDRAGARRATWRFCENAELDACNWIIPANEPRPLLRRVPPQPHRPGPFRPREDDRLAKDGNRPSTA